MNDRLISVIIPVYNVETCFSECMDSVIAQTWKELDIILIDDGSTDSSGKICEEYAAMDSRIHVIHQKNQGLSGARNTGLSEVSGDWIVFVDSDDRVNPVMMEKMWEIAHKQKTKMVVCGMFSFRESENGYIKDGELLLGDGVWSEKEYWDYYDIGGPMICDVVWNKLYKADLWKNERFIPGKLNEDALIMHRIVGQCKTISTVGETLYEYRLRGKSIMHQDYNVRRLDVVEAYLTRTEYLTEKGLFFQGDRMLAQAVYFLVEGWHLLDLNSEKNKIRYTELRRHCRALCFEALRRRGKRKTRVQFLLFLFGESVYYTMFRLKEFLKKPEKRAFNG